MTSHKGRYGRYLSNLVAIGDFVMFNLAFLLTYLLVGRFSPWPMRELLMAVNVAYVPVYFLFNTANSRRSIYMERVVRNALLAAVAHCCVFALMLPLIGVLQIRWQFFAVFYPIVALLLALWWIAARLTLKHFRRKGRNFVRAVIVGTNPTARRLHREITTDTGYGYRFMGFFADDPSGEIDPSLYRGTLADLADFIEREHIDEVYYAISGEHPTKLHTVIDAAEANVARFYYVPQINRYVNRDFSLQAVGSVPVLQLHPQPLESLFNRCLKRSFDLLFSSVALICSPVIFIPVAIAIKCSSPGPVFFRQKRTGYRGRDFMCWKFRTMRVNADADTAQATRDDPRKTRVGDFLRRTSIDELPQFINVWLGSMSVVGPRPHMLKHTEQYRQMVSQYMLRHVIKPGITGWAQVSGLRGQTDEVWKMQKRVEHDVWYIQNWSFLLDIKIIYMTLANAIRGEKNAF